MEKEEKLHLVPSQDPKGLYLYGLGKAIQELCPKETESYWFNSEDDYLKRKEFIEIIHKHAMEVINIK